MGKEEELKGEGQDVELGQENTSYDDAWQEETVDQDSAQEEQDDTPDDDLEVDPEPVESATTPTKEAEPAPAVISPEIQAELARIRAENEALKQKMAEAQATHKEVDVFPMGKMPDDYAEFAQKYPELAQIALEYSPVGIGIRERLETYGPEEAAEFATPVMEGRKAKEKESLAIRQEEEKRAAEQHMVEWQQQVFTAVPELYAAVQAGQNVAYIREVEQWAKSKPYEEAAALLAVIERGSAEQTIALLNTYKAEKAQQKSSAKKKAADALAAVPGHPNPLGIRQEGKKDDYDRAWEED